MGEATPPSGLIAEIVTTGTEILLGDIVDTNAAWIAQQLREVGVNLYYKTTVGDNEERLRGVLLQSMARCDVIVVTGGLGPTVDDITRQAIANATQRRLVLDAGALEQLKDRFVRFHTKMTENNTQQAHIPEGATLIENPVGTAPGFAVDTGRCTVIALPGVPREMKRMMTDSVLPWLRAKAGGAVIRRRILRTMGIGESTIDSLLDDLMRQPNPTVGLAAHMGQADVRIAARAESAAAAEKALDAIEAEIRTRIGAYIYSTTPDEKYETYLVRRLQEHGFSVGLLETNTRGLVAERLSSALPDYNPVRRSLVSSSPHVPEVLGSTLVLAPIPAEGAVRAAAQALARMSDATVNVAAIGSTGEGEGIYGATAGETWLALCGPEGTQAARLPYGGTEEFTVARIGNFVMRMIDDAVDGLLKEVGK